MVGFKKQGLVHVSQISSARVENVEEVLAVGEEVWVKVILLDNDKISLAMRYVNQGSGQDLDRNEVQLELERIKGRKGKMCDQKAAIKLDAVFNITCTRCGGHGHIPAQCYANPGDKYELIDDIDFQIPTNITVEKKDKKKRKTYLT